MTETPGILVVDDQPATLTALEELLAPLGHKVITARSGEEALRRLLDEDFGVIVMDVRMPGMDGFETVELIRQRRRHEHTAIMFLTAADADAEQIRRGYSAGAVDYIVKPVDPDVLRSKVAMLLALVQKNAELRESERRFRAAFESAPIGMGLSSADGRWIEVNNALCDMLGLPRADLLERPPAELPHPEDRERHQEALERVLRDGRGFHQAELRFIRSDGEVGYALVSLSLSLDAQERPLQLIWQVLDMTDRRRAAMETAARVRAETLAGTHLKLQKVTAAALEQLTLRGTLEALVEGIAEAFGADLARILLRDPDDESQLRVGAASGFRGLAPGDAVPLTAVLDQVLAGPRAITLADLSAETELDPSLAARKPRALMATALSVNEKVAGVVEVGLCSSRRWDADEESLLGLMADRAGFAIGNARAYERELDTVKVFQTSLLPKVLPQPDGVRIGAHYESGSDAVGGDWYDALELGSGRVAVAMGDVVGHGLGAAALMAQLRHATRAYALDGHSPGGVLDRLDSLVRSLDGGQMATLLYLVVEPDRSSVDARQRWTRAAAHHRSGRASGVSGDATRPAPRGVREREPQRGRGRAGAGLDARPLHGRARRAARRVDRRRAGGAARGGARTRRRPRGALRAAHQVRCGTCTRATTTSRCWCCRRSRCPRGRCGSSSPRIRTGSARCAVS